ncbi:MAG TPA: winged helix-turn-helix transcriptional regulator [Solirubrobacterales bacterium]
MDSSAALRDSALSETAGSAQCAPPTIGTLLRLLSAGAGGPILMALGSGPLRTKELVERVPHYAARTVYRYAERLVQLGLVEREERAEIPSVVIYNLAPGAGTDLHTLLSAQAASWLSAQPSGQIGAQAWASLGMLADLWELGIVEELSRGGRSVTQLAQGCRDLTFHQIARRTNQFLAADLLEKRPGAGSSKHFGLTRQARRGMGLIAAVGRWRHRHLGASGEAGLTRGEMATVLRATLPLVRLPAHAGLRFALCVEDAEDEVLEADGAVLGATVGRNGLVHPDPEAVVAAEAWARARVGDWLDALIDGGCGGVRAGGAGELVESFLDHLHGALWAAGR